MGSVLPTPVNDGELYLSIRPHYILALKVISSIVSCLSIIGATLVLVSHTSWCKFGEDRTKWKWGKALRYVFCDYPQPTVPDPEAQLHDPANRQEADQLLPVPARKRKNLLPTYHYFIICICISDILVSCSHIWGVAQNLETKFIGAYVDMHQNFSNETLRSGTDTACTAQAIVAVFSTVASFMWTFALACFLCFSECFPKCTNTYIMKEWCGASRVKKDQRNDPHCCATSLYTRFLCPLLGWGIPAALFAALATKDLLGFTQGIDVAWCYLHLHDETFNYHQQTLTIILGYELFVWGPLFGIAFFFLSFSILLCCRYCCGLCIDSEDHQNYKLNGVHCRYMCIVAIFVILRVPNTIADIIILSDNPESYKDLSVAISTLFAGATNSAQGLVNAFLFICCTSSARVCCCKPACKPRH